MIVRVLAEAHRELLDATEYYERQQSGLGRRLWREVDEHIGWIMRHPELPRVRSGDYRRVNLRVFPYYIASLLRGETLWVLAIAHTHRKPTYWIGRRR